MTYEYKVHVAHSLDFILPWLVLVIQHSGTIYLDFVEVGTPFVVDFVEVGKPFAVFHDSCPKKNEAMQAI